MGCLACNTAGEDARPFGFAQGSLPAAGTAALRKIWRTLLVRIQAVEHLPQLIGSGAIDYVAGASVRGLLEQEFTAAVAVRIYHVDQVEARRYVEMVLVG